MPGAPVHRISFSAPSAPPIAAATVSALMLSSCPAASDDSGLTTGRKPASSRRVMHGGVDRVDVADHPVIDDLAVCERDGRAAVRAHQPAVDARKPDRRDPELAAQRQQPRVDEAVQHHAGRVDRRVVGDAAALHHARLDAEPRGDLVELRPAAVHQHDADAEVVQDRDLLDERAHRRGLAERAAAGLDHEDLALVHVDVRRRAAQGAHRDGVFDLVSDHRCMHPSRVGGSVGGEHPVQHRHLHDHAIGRVGDDA